MVNNKDLANVIIEDVLTARWAMKNLAKKLMAMVEEDEDVDFNLGILARRLDAIEDNAASITMRIDE